MSGLRRQPRPCAAVSAAAACTAVEEVFADRNSRQEHVALPLHALLHVCSDLLMQ